MTLAEQARQLIDFYERWRATGTLELNREAEAWFGNCVEILRLVADSQPQIVSISHGNGAERHTVQILSPEGQYDDA